MAIQRGKEIAKAKQNLCQQDKDNLTKLQLELDQIYEDKARGAFVRSRRKWLEEGQKNTKKILTWKKEMQNLPP